MKEKYMRGKRVGRGERGREKSAICGWSAGRGKCSQEKPFCAQAKLCSTGPAPEARASIPLPPSCCSPSPPPLVLPPPVQWAAAATIPPTGTPTGWSRRSRLTCCSMPTTRSIGMSPRIPSFNYWGGGLMRGKNVRILEGREEVWKLWWRVFARVIFSMHAQLI